METVWIEVCLLHPELEDAWSCEGRAEIMDRDTDVVSGWALAMQAQWPFLDSNLNHLVPILIQL